MGFVERSRSPAIVLTTSEQHPVSYFLEAPGAEFYANGTIYPRSKTVVHIPYNLAVWSYNDLDKGIYVKTGSNRVTVIGRVGKHWRSPFRAGISMEVYAAIPVIDLNINKYEYFALSVNSSSSYYNSVVLVVGTKDGTAMKLTSTQAVTVRVGNKTINLTAGREYSFVINRLQTLYIASPDDLSGTKITTSKPVTVLSGHVCAAVPWNGGRCGYLIEQIPPTALWGKLHYVAPFASFWSGYAIKIVAAKHCVVYMYCSEVWTVTLNGGESVLKMFLNNEACAIHSSATVLVVQFSLSHFDSNHFNHAGPVMTIIPPTGHYNNIIFSSIDFDGDYDYHSDTLLHHITIVVLAQYYQPHMIYLMSGGVNKSLDTQEWVPIMVNNSVEAYAAKLFNISNNVSEILHTNSSALMTIMSYGFGYMSSTGFGSAIIYPHGKGTCFI